MYLTYEQYQEYGGTLEETAFELLEFEARSVVDWWTFNRLQNETEYPEAVKFCMLKLIELINDKRNAMTVDNDLAEGEVAKVKSIASQSNDGVSISYNTLTAKDAVDTLTKEEETTIRIYLSGIKNSLGYSLLYRGLYPNE